MPWVRFERTIPSFEGTKTVLNVTRLINLRRRWVRHVAHIDKWLKKGSNSWANCSELHIWECYETLSSNLNFFSCGRSLTALHGELHAFLRVSRQIFSREKSCAEKWNTHILYCLFLQPALCCFVLRPWRWRRHVPPKSQLIFNGLRGVISQKIEFIVAAVRTSNPVQHIVFTSQQFV
jgi:hypothetical protein